MEPPATSQTAAIVAVEHHRFSRAEIGDPVRIWVFIAILATAYATFYQAGFGKVRPADHLWLAAAVAALALVAALYTTLRPDARLARLFRSAAELTLLSFFTGGLSYAAATLNQPLVDGALDAWDRALGFHWREWLDLLNAHPLVHYVLAVSYHSMIPQFGLVLVALVTVRAYRTLDIFLLALGIAATVSVVVSGFLPALSPLVHYGIVPSDHPNITLAVPLEFERHVQALREGSMRMIDLSGAQGLVTFPSFHTASSVLLLLAFCQVPYVRWPALALNGLLLLSVPIEGSHYLVDLIAGVFVALSSWYAAHRMIRTVEQD